jgi:hypothetical protein
VIACDWQAWYDRLPGSLEPPLHVAGSCEVDGSIVALRLEPAAEDVPEEPGVIALTLVAERADGGDTTQLEQQISWTGQPDQGVERVRIGGEANSLVEVRARPSRSELA